MKIESNSHEVTNAKVLELLMAENIQDKKVLDLGAGFGYFTQLAYNALNDKNIDPTKILHASDISPDAYQFDKIPCKYGDFNAGLPYEENFFDVICSIEVIEHLEDQFKYIREIKQILKPGGTLLITTPNILNINSRLRYFSSGLYPLFDILPINDDVASCDGHINPISYIYLTYILKSYGFKNIELYSDRNKKSALALSILSYPLIWLLSTYTFSKFKKKNPDTYAKNKDVIKNINSFDTLTSRTIVIKATK